MSITRGVELSRSSPRTTWVIARSGSSTALASRKPGVSLLPRQMTKSSMSA